MDIVNFMTLNKSSHGKQSFDVCKFYRGLLHDIMASNKSGILLT